MEIWDKLVEAARAMTALEIAGVAFNLACVILTIRRSVWCWPVGIVGIVLFFVLFWKVRLYAELVTQTVFFVLSIYGWWQWLKGGPDRTPLVVTRPPLSVQLGSVALIASLAPAMGYALARWTNAASPYWDSLITVMSLVAQWMLAKKWLENWLLWIAVDAVAVPVYAGRELYLTAALYAVFLVLAAGGFAQWLRVWRRARTATSVE